MVEPEATSARWIAMKGEREEEIGRVVVLPGLLCRRRARHRLLNAAADPGSAATCASDGNNGGDP